MTDKKELIHTILETEYDLGEITKISLIPAGLVNESYSVYVKDNNNEEKHLFFRLYAEEKSETEIEYEMGLMFHIRKKGFTENACPVLSRHGGTHVSFTMDAKERFAAVQEWLEGDEPYGWEYCPITPGELSSAAELVAKLHSLSADFAPPAGYAPKRPPISRHIAGYPENLKMWLEDLKNERGKEHFVQYMESRMPKILDWIASARPVLEEARELPHTHIHTDAHPGNFKFSRGKAVGLFDFDWAQYDFRVYELAFMLTTFSSEWMQDNNGSHSEERMKNIIESYNREIIKRDCCVGALEPGEIEILPEMMIVCNILMLQETVHQLYDDRSRNEFEYLYYVVHCVEGAAWADNHRGLITGLCGGK